MTETELLVQRCIERDAARHDSLLVAVLEREGDKAFEVLRERLGGKGRAIGAEQLPAALRLLVAISTHRGRARGQECLKILLPFVRDPSRAVRTTAAHLIVWNRSRVATPVDDFPTAKDLQSAVAEALALGVEEPHRALFERFVASVSA